MINATFALPTNIVSNTMFNGTITFESAVTMVEAADFTITAVDGNGVTGVSFTVTQQTTSVYSLNFTIPADTEGAFSVEATGMVLPDGESQEVGINATPAAPVITYDTSVAVAATWGTPDYTVDDRDGQVAIDITFASEVVVTDAAVFQFGYTPDTPDMTPGVNESLEGLQAAINGDGTDWTLTLTLPLDLKGDIVIDTIGEVFKVTTMVYDTVTIPALTVAVNTLIPQVTRREESPEPYTPGMRCDLLTQLNTAVQFENPTVYYDDPNATILDFFAWVGKNDVGQPNFYVYTGTDPDAQTLPLPDTLPADWVAWVPTVAKSELYLFRYNPIESTAEGYPSIEVKAGTCYNPGSP